MNERMASAAERGGRVPILRAGLPFLILAAVLFLPLLLPILPFAVFIPVLYFSGTVRAFVPAAALGLSPSSRSPRGPPVV